MALVDYTVACSKKTRDWAKTIRGSIEEGRGEEFYTEEHDKLLGSCEVPWTLFVDGYDKDGKRIKIMSIGKFVANAVGGVRVIVPVVPNVSLSKVNYVEICLYMRYGENVLEAIKNPDYICPTCRGICNCRCCRNKKGWYAIGFYNKIVNLGYKSTAHCLIQTRRKPGNSNKEPCSETEAFM